MGDRQGLVGLGGGCRRRKQGGGWGGGREQVEGGRRWDWGRDCCHHPHPTDGYATAWALKFPTAPFIFPAMGTAEARE